MKKSLPFRLTALLLVAILTLSLAACGKDNGSASSSSVDSNVPVTTGKPVQNGFNMLTGKNDMTTANDRLIGYVITDEDSRHIQLNLEDADFYFESETEAGIPRILAVFSSFDRVPDEIGPVRSARPHFAKFASALDAIYCHIGGSSSGLAAIQKYGIDDVYNASVVNNTLKNSQNLSWNRKTFPKTKVFNEIKQRGHALTTDYAGPYQFGTKEGTNAATTVDVKISASYHMAFTYVADRGVYQKHRNSLSSAIHTTYTGGTIEASNVIVMFDKRFTDPLDAKRVDFTLEAGSGILATGGKSREIWWKITEDGLKYYEIDGVTPLTVAEGKTFVCLTSDTFKSQTVVK